jgi:flagellar basal-body rod protein FlgF
MNDGYHALGSALSSVMHRLDVSARNTVNAQTPGYLRDIVQTSSFASSLDRELDRPAALVTSHVGVDFSQGTLIARDEPLALGLEGPGFLTVQTPNGVAYTRNGDLTVSPTGVLQTRAGYPVLAENGPVRIDLRGGVPSVDTEGNVLQNGAEVARLRVVEFADRTALRRVSETLFTDSGSAQPSPAQETTVHSRRLEIPMGSTVSGMVDMIAAGRAFDAAQRVTRSIDESFQHLTRPN